MRTLSLISIAIAVLGLAAYSAMGDSAPPFVLPLVLVSGAAAIIFILANMVLNMVQSRKKYRCLNCGTVLHGGDPARLGNVCPNCGGSAFR